MKTKFSALIHENDMLETKLTAEDSKVIKQIIKYLSLDPVSSVDAQILRKDLIGMAQEARTRGERLQDMVGDDIKVFCESLSQNIRTDKTEYRLRLLFTGLWMILFLYLVDWGVYNSFAVTHSIKIGWMFTLPLILVLWLCLNRYFEKKSIFGLGNKEAVCLIGSVLLIICIRYIIPSNLSTFLAAELLFVPGLPAAIILFLATGIVYLFLWLRRNRKDDFSA